MGGSQQPKWYGVRVGMRPGVYTTWPDCQRQINGYKGAIFKSFLTRKDAELFVAGKTPPASADAKQKGPRFYGVAAGKKTGVFTNWADVVPLIDGFVKPAYKKFETRQAAEEWVANYKATDRKRPLKGAAKYNAQYEDGDDDGDDADEKKDEEGEDDDFMLSFLEEPAAKKVKTSAGAVAKRPEPKKGTAEMHIYTDGSARGNGQAGARAGVGVWFGPDDQRNVSERLAGDPQTNQRAELTALLRAFQAANYDGPIRILTDSQYSINCVTVWCKNWIRSGWMTKTGPVKNRDLVEAVLEAQKEHERRGGSVVYQWVKGHGSSVGNNAADALAVAGADKPLPPPLMVQSSSSNNARGYL